MLCKHSRIRLELSSSLLCQHGLCDALCTSVGLVDLGIFSKSSSLQVATVKVVDRLLHNDRLRPTKVLVNTSDNLGLLGLGGALGSRLCEELCTVLIVDQNIHSLGVCQSTVLELVERFQVTRLRAEAHLVASLGVAVLPIQEGIVALHEFPAELVRNRHHISIFWAIKSDESGKGDCPGASC